MPLPRTLERSGETGSKRVGIVKTATRRRSRAFIPGERRLLSGKSFRFLQRAANRTKRELLVSQNRRYHVRYGWTGFCAIACRHLDSVERSLCILRGTHASRDAFPLETCHFVPPFGHLGSRVGSSDRGEMLEGPLHLTNWMHSMFWTSNSAEFLLTFL